jgi:hypothetical protein
MRLLCALLLVGALSRAGDLVHLANGRILAGSVVDENDDAVVIEVGTGTMSIPRRLVRLVERGAGTAEPGRAVTQRDEWFLVLHAGKLVGWHRFVHTEGPQRVQVEERTVFFRPGGGDDVDIRRVEVADAEGRPVEFLHMETYGNRMEVISGQAIGSELVVQIRRDGRLETRTFETAPDWTLALPAWSRFQRESGAAETRRIVAFDPRRLATVELVLRREADGVDPTGDPRPCQAITLSGDVRHARSFYRPGEGAVSLELNGATLVAHRSTRERVEMARRAHRAPEPLGIEQALRYPFHERPKDLAVYQPQAGLALRAPDAGWIATTFARERGRVMSFEKIGIFGSLEAFVYDLPREGVALDACVARAVSRLELTARSVAPVGQPTALTVDGNAARRLVFDVRHRGEDLRCELVVVVTQSRYVVLVGAVPRRHWRWAAPAFESFRDTLEIAP